MFYQVKIDFSNKYAFYEWRDASDFVQVALDHNLDKGKKIELALVDEDPDEDPEEAEK